MKHNRAQLVQIIREIFEEIPLDDGDRERGARLLAQKLAERCPNTNRDEFQAAYEAYRHEENEITLEIERQAEELKADVEMCEGFPEGMPFNEIVRIRALDGHPRALAYQALWSSPEHRVHMALFEAAVDAHPAWRRDEVGYSRDENMNAPEDDSTLVEWFQLTHPRAASAIHARIMGEAA